MKLFINSLLIALLSITNFVGCSSKPEEAQQQQSTKEIVEDIEPIKLPENKTPVAEKQVQEVQPTEQVKLATTTESSSKTYYPNEVIIQVKNWDQKLKFLKTHFEQTSEYDGVPISKSQGTLWYDKDKNLLRLDTLNTDNDVEQSAITDKKQILILDGQGHEVTTLSWQEWQQGQPNQALFDFGNYTSLLARHNAVLKEPYLLELTPKEGEQYTLYLTLAKEDYFPTNIKIVADLMTTEAKLTNTQKNTPLAFDTFRAGGLFK